MSKNIETDICIIGAGSAGLSLAAGAAQLGRNVVLVEKGEMGGDCLNYGCVPSKALLAAASAAQTIRTAAKFGVSPNDPEIDFAKVMDHVRGVIAAIAPIDSQERFEGFGVTVIREKGEFTGPRTLRAGDHTITAKHFVIATGSSPYVPPIEGAEAVGYFTNETIFDNRVRPDHLIIIGGGPIGVEMAQAHRRLGSDVTIIEAQTILNNDDPECVEIVRSALTGEGVAIRENAMAARVEKSGSTIKVIIKDDQSTAIIGSHLLMAVGRSANVQELGLDAAGVKYSRRGVDVNARLRSSNKRIYALGDVAGGMQFTHMAGDHASTAVRNILFKMPAKRRDHLAPRVTYCDPELASIGLPEEAAKEKFREARTVTWGFKENDRAQTEKRTDGFIKATAKPNGEIIGVSIVGKNAGDLIGAWSLAMANKMKIKAFTNYIAPYPTRGEISKRAGGAWFTPALFSDRTRKLIKILAVLD